jgi:hypothetical protein
VIDVENEIFSRVAAAVRAAFPSVFMSGEYIRTPPKFPFVSLVEMSNTAYDRTQSSAGLENHASLMYEVNVYSNRTSGKKSECKAILAIIDSLLVGMGFTRTMKNPVTMDDATIYRVISRYTAIVSKNQTIYRR